MKIKIKIFIFIYFIIKLIIYLLFEKKIIKFKYIYISYLTKILK